MKKEIFKKMLIEKEMKIEYLDPDDTDDFFGGKIVRLTPDEILAAKKRCLEIADNTEIETGIKFAATVSKAAEKLGDLNAQLVAMNLMVYGPYVKADFIAGNKQ